MKNIQLTMEKKGVEYIYRAIENGKVIAQRSATKPTYVGATISEHKRLTAGLPYGIVNCFSSYQRSQKEVKDVSVWYAIATLEPLDGKAFADAPKECRSCGAPLTAGDMCDSCDDANIAAMEKDMV